MVGLIVLAVSGAIIGGGSLGAILTQPTINKLEEEYNKVYQEYLQVKEQLKELQG